MINLYNVSYLYLLPCVYKSFPSVCSLRPSMSQPTQSWASASTTTTAQSMDSTPPTSTSSHSRPPTSTNTRYPPPPTDKPYPGSGTPQDPFIVGWVPDDPENPYNWSKNSTMVYYCSGTTFFHPRSINKIATLTHSLQCPPLPFHSAALPTLEASKASNAI